MRRATLFKTFDEISRMTQKELADMLVNLNDYDLIYNNGIEHMDSTKMRLKMQNKYSMEISISDFANLIFAEVSFRVLKNKMKKKVQNGD